MRQLGIGLAALALVTGWALADEQASGDTAKDEPLLAGSVTYGMNATIWKLDDSFSSNLIDLTTERSTPVFQELHAELEHRPSGFKLALSLSADQLAAIGGLFDKNLAGAGSSGGIETHLSLPLVQPLGWLGLLDSATRSELGDIRLEAHYKYRVFRWTSSIKSVWLDTVADYYDENGNRTKYNVGQSFETASRWHDLQLGLAIPLTSYDRSTPPLGVLSVGLEYFNLLAPTLVGLDRANTTVLTPSAYLIMQTYNDFVGLRGSVFFGYDPAEVLSLSEPVNLAAELGMAIGTYSASNQYFQGPGSLGFNINGGLYAAFVLKPGADLSIVIAAGFSGTFSLMDTFGSADDPGTIKSKLVFRSLGSDASFPAGTAVSVSVDRWELYGGPSLLVSVRF